MKGLLSLKLLILCLFAFASIATAGTDSKMMQKNMSKGLWVCETNASSSSQPQDQKADEMLKNKRPAAVAFGAAVKNCRDCTKITCTLENDNTQTNNSNTKSSW